jgi:hypothetical protein
MPVNLTIREGDIKVGKRKSQSYCPTAYCLKRVFGRNDVTVFRDFAFVGPFMLEIPPHISKFIEDFDKKLAVRGQEWQLPEPPKELTYKSDH